MPLYDTCNRYLGKWVKRAGIKKKISWHCARHSFAVNVLNRGANIKTVSSLLGHTSLKMTERYLHVVDSLKQDAIDSLGEIKFSAVGSWVNYTSIVWKNRWIVMICRFFCHICPTNDNIMPFSCHKHIYKIKITLDIVVFCVLRKPRDSRVCQTL